MVNRNRNMKYLLTLEKFKSNILSKLYKATLHHTGFKIFLNNMLENEGIQISELKDEYFKYIPVNKIVKDKKEVEIKEDEYKIHENGNFIEGSIEEGDFLVENDGYVHKVKSLDLTYKEVIKTNITEIPFKSSSVVWNDFFKIPKKYSDDLIVSNGNNDLPGALYSLKISGDQVWKHTTTTRQTVYVNPMDSSKSKEVIKTDVLSDIYPMKESGTKFISASSNRYLIKQYGLKQLIKNYKYDLKFNDNDIVFGFDLTNTIQYYSRGSFVELGELKKSSDYVIIFDYGRAIKELSNVEGKRKEREERKEGSLHLMSEEDILKMNKDRLISKLASRYKVSEESLSDIKKYTDFEKILKKVFEKNPVLVLSDRNMISDIRRMVTILLNIPKYINNKDQEGVFKSMIKELNQVYSRIIKNPLVLYKLNIFEGDIFENTFKSKLTFPIELLRVNKELDKLRENIKSYINNFEYENLNDVLAIFVKINSYREAAERLDFFLHDSVIQTNHRPDTSKEELENQYIRSISQNIPYKTRSFDKYIEDIKTLIKLW